MSCLQWFSIQGVFPSCSWNRTTVNQTKVKWIKKANEWMTCWLVTSQSWCLLYSRLKPWQVVAVMLQKKRITLLSVFINNVLVYLTETFFRMLKFTRKNKAPFTQHKGRLNPRSLLVSSPTVSIGTGWKLNIVLCRAKQAQRNDEDFKIYDCKHMTAPFMCSMYLLFFCMDSYRAAGLRGKC